MTAASQNLRRSTVAITGASAGVGRAVAHRFARAGAKLALIARDSDALQQVKKECDGLGGTAMVFAADVADADSVSATVNSIIAATGSLEIWINDAMVTVFSPVWEITPEEFRRVTEVTYLGVVHGTMAALRYMRPRNRGTIIQIGSALAYRGIPLQAAYCGAKHAIRGFTNSLRSEFNSYPQRHQAVDHRTAGSEHAAIRLGSHPHGAPAAPSATGRATRSRGGDRLSRRSPSTA